MAPADRAAIPDHATIREAVLAAWSASPARFREDANAEEDLVVGSYRDRVIVELAQNAADAAARAGEAGRLLLTLQPGATGGTLVAANTGAGLDAEGVQALASLRASAKREDDPGRTVGRFGIGFAATLAVTDEPVVLSRPESVRFSRTETLDAVAAVAAGNARLRLELERREGRVPVLRLPFDSSGTAPVGYQTAVILPLRDQSAADLVERLLAEVDDALLLALPALGELEIHSGSERRRIADVENRWWTYRVSGQHAPQLLADRPVEERTRTGWQVTWALPRRGQSWRRVVHAPTPTDEPCTLPALLVATLPLDPGRRRLAPGPLTDATVASAGKAYAALLRQRAEAGDEVLELVPVGLPSGDVDAALHRAVLQALSDTPVLRCVEPAPDGATRLVRPGEAVRLDGGVGADGAVLAALAPMVAGLVAAPVGSRAALEVLGVQRISLSGVVEQLPTSREPREWRALYAALRSVADDAEGREGLGTMPVPLADGRLVRGARGVLVPTQLGDETIAAQALGVLSRFGLRLVHAEAVDPLLERLGAVPVGPRELLASSAVEAAVEESADLDGQEAAAVVDAVLAIARAAPSADGAGDAPAWLGDLALPDSDGVPTPASALALPGGVAAELLDPEEIGLVDPALVERWGAGALRTVGVLDGLAVLRATDVVADGTERADLPPALAELDDVAGWLASVTDACGAAGEPAVIPEVLAVRDLDAIRPEAWLQAFRVIGQDPALRAALVAPVRARVGARVVDVPSYTGWWLRRHATVGGTHLGALRDPAGDPALATLMDDAPGELLDLDAALLRALGVVQELDQLADAPPSVLQAVLERLADGGVGVELPHLLRLWRALAAIPAALGMQVHPPGQVRALARGGGPDSPSMEASISLVAREDAVVLDSPMWWQRVDLRYVLLPGSGLAEGIADLLDVALASEVADGSVTSSGSLRQLPAGLRSQWRDAPREWAQHQRLTVDGESVRWWVAGQGSPTLHAVNEAELGYAVAQASGQWHRRAALVALAGGATGSGALLVQDALG